MHCRRCEILPTVRAKLETLQMHRQRATYQAFGEAIGTSPRQPLLEHVHDPLHSWVVGSDGMPIGYDPDEMHPELKKRAQVIADGDELRKWFASPS